MKKIKTISLTSLRVEEDFGFQKLILAETANLPGQGEDEPGLPEVQSARTANPVLTNVIATFTDAFNAFRCRPENLRQQPIDRHGSQRRCRPRQCMACHECLREGDV